ncbi:MAG: phosphatase PAP2 family protein [Candidatus Bathyarchaeia archaeon]
MNSFCLKRPYVLTVVYLIITIVIGLFVVFLPLNQPECKIVLDLHNFTQRTIGLQAFQVLTYLGDFYFWAVLTSVYLLYACFKSRKHLGSATELVVFLVITTALTSFLQVAFARPRPNCSGMSDNDENLFSSFSYPSGHVSRATGGFLNLAKGSKTRQSLAVIAISIVSLSRVILEAHYLTDVVGGIFLSLAAQKLANLSLPFLFRAWHKHW